jgi:hypothetical protein
MWEALLRVAVAAIAVVQTPSMIIDQFAIDLVY